MNDKAAGRGRETSATAREDAVDLREMRSTCAKGQPPRASGTFARRKRHRQRQTNTCRCCSKRARLIISTIEAHKLSEQLEIAKTQLETAQAVAEKANLAKSNFLSSMSHEFRSRSMPSLGFAQLLQAGSPPPTATQTEKLHQIIKAGWYLLDLINEILDLAVIESGKVSLSLEPLSQMP